MILGLIRRYADWLHTRWPAGTVEKLPVIDPDGSTNIPGLYVVGDLTGVPLLKLASDSGARAVSTIDGDPAFQKRRPREGVVDLAIVGGGVSGMAAALEAHQRGLTLQVIEASEPFSTIVNFPARKPIYTYPTEMTPTGALHFSERSAIKEGLIEELRERTAHVKTRNARAERIVRNGDVLEVELAEQEPLRAHRVIVAIGRSGNFRRLGVSGEDLDKVSNRLHDPRDYRGQRVLVVGGGDSALESAIALAESGAQVTLSYRKKELTRPKPENVARLERLDTTLLLGSHVSAITPQAVTILGADGESGDSPNDAVFTMLGREPPLDFFRRSGVAISGEWTRRAQFGLAAFLAFTFWLYHWKSGHAIPGWGPLPTALSWQPKALWDALAEGGGALTDPSTLLGTLRISASGASFYYTVAYSMLVAIFGWKRIRRRKTAYVKIQTLTLTAVQWLPLFLLPEIILPWLGHNGWFEGGVLGGAADALFPLADYGHGREYWRAYGLILAFPLNVYNWYTHEPLWGWILVGGIQTFVLIPVIVYYWGKGAYCGWICSCGALAETLGDTQRHKMPHGPLWNRLNLVGQVILFIAFALMTLRILGWIWPGSWPARAFERGFHGTPLLNYGWFVDIFLAGIIGYGLYFRYSGRVWCRFACPLAALMHIYVRFSRFRILAEKKKCISCNVCTSVCHQGIDVMSFANKGLPMEDPECVRCSACVQSCPTGVLAFGQIDPRTGETLKSDPGWLAASPVQMVELGRR